MTSLAVLSLLVASHSSVGHKSSAETVPTDPILRIEAGMHTAKISGIAADGRGRYLVTGGDDKSVRVWEMPDLRLVRVLRPPVNSASEGKLYAVAISKDGSTIAAGGYTGWDWAGSGSVYLFDRASGRMTRRIRNLPNLANALAFSADGRRLAIGLLEGGLRVVSLSSGATSVDSSYGDSIYGLDFDPSGRLAVTCDDGTVRLYDSELNANAQAAVKKTLPRGFRPHGIAFSPDASKLAIGDDTTPQVFVMSGKTLEKLDFVPDKTGLSGGGTSAVAWSSDGMKLSAAGAASTATGHVVRVWSDGGRGASQDFAAGANTIQALAPIPGGGIAFAGEGSFGVVDRGSENPTKSISIIDPREMGSAFRVTGDGDTLQFAFRPKGKELYRFSVSSRELRDASAEDAAHSPGASPETTDPALEITEWELDTPKLNGVPLKIGDDEKSHCLAILPDHRSFVLGTEGGIRSYGADGRRLWSTDTAGAVWAVNASRNGRVVVAALEDGTVRWYRANDGKELLALYAHSDRTRWILWTPSGYYDCSAGGEDLLGWSLNNGPDHDADFFPAGRFRSAYYRPDVTARILSTCDEAKALSEANATAPHSAPLAIQKTLPPIVRIASDDGQDAGGQTLKIKYTVESSPESPVKKVEIWVDGRRVSTISTDNGAAKNGQELTAAIPRPAPDSIVSVIAYNAYGASEPTTVGTRFRSSSSDPLPPIPPLRPKPTLYILSIGVGKFADSRVGRLAFPAKDATDFVATMTRQKGMLYKDIKARLLVDPTATHTAILNGLTWLEQQTTEDDVAMVFMAGHGEDDQVGNYSFLPSDFNVDESRATRIGFSEIVETVRKLPCKRLFFIDTCRSGGVMGKGTFRGSAHDINAAINELGSAENAAIVFTACTENQSAIEKDEWGHGAFTKILLEGLGGKASTDGFSISVAMLNLYLKTGVKNLTGGQQAPTAIIPQSVRDFPIALIPPKPAGNPKKPSS